MSELVNHRESTVVAAINPNPECLLSLLQGQWAAWLPGAESPIRLNNAELLALGNPKNTDDQALLEKMLSNGLLRDAPVEFAAPRASVKQIACDGPLGLPGDFLKNYRVNHHFAMRNSGDGFMAYSERQQCYVIIPVMAAAALTGSQNHDASVNAPDPAPDDALLQQFVDYGFLLPLAESQSVEVRKNEAVEFARYAKGGVSAALQDRDPEADLDGRIPVYFAGCIDLAMDMSYGYLNLALGMIRAMAENYEGGILNDRYYMVPHFLLSPSAVAAAAETYGPGVVFFSNYIWAHEGNLSASRELKAIDERFVCVFGGPQAPSYEKDVKTLYSEHPHVDILVRGEGEVTASVLLDKLIWSADKKPDLSAVTEVEGIAYRDENITGFHHTLERARLKDLSTLPSPYLTGVFDEVPRKILYGATLETNRGCPYGCTFCDWGSATRQKIRRFDLERIRQELDWIGQAGISVLFIADANFGVFKRDIEIAQMIAETAERYGALKQVVTNYAKNATENLAEIVRLFARSGLASEGIISIQTRDAQTLHVINRDNIKNRKYDELLDVFREQRLPMSTDLMIGLPGATPDSFKSDLQHYFEKGVQAKAYLTRMLVNSPMAEPNYIDTHSIETDDNGFMLACDSYSVKDRDYMLDLFGLYSLAVGYGLFKYLLYYLQWDKDIRCIDFIDAFLREVKAAPGRYPLTHWVLGFLDNQLHSPGGWRPVLEEVAGFAESHFDVPWDSSMDTVLLAQEAVLADPDKVADRTWQLKHDFTAYYRESEQRGPLSSYGPGELTVQDIYGVCRMDPMRHYQYDTHSVAWELESALNDVDRPVFFLEKDASLAMLSWPKRTAIGQRAW